MRRYWLPDAFIEPQKVRVEGEAFHHIRDVCRLEEGDRFEAIKEQTAYTIEITHMEKRFFLGQVLSQRLIPELPRPHLHLLISLPKFPIFEGVLEKAVELGVASVQPLFSEYSFLRKHDTSIDKKWPRWEKIIESATQQSGRGELMRLLPPLPLLEKIKGFNPDNSTLGLLAYEGQDGARVQKAMEGLSDKGFKEVWAVVGSEGGFSLAEVKQMQEAGLKSISLGAQILRVETACVAFLSILKYGLNI